MIDATQVNSLPDRMPAGEFMTFGSRRLSADGTSDTNFAVYHLSQVRRKKLNKGHGTAIVEETTSVNTIIFQIYGRSVDEATAVSPATLPCPQPKVGDYLEDDDVRYWIAAVPNAVESKLFGTIYNCVCRQRTPIQEAKGA